METGLMFKCHSISLNHLYTISSISYTISSILYTISRHASSNKKCRIHWPSGVEPESMPSRRIKWLAVVCKRNRRAVWHSTESNGYDPIHTYICIHIYIYTYICRVYIHTYITLHYITYHYIHTITYIPLHTYHYINTIPLHYIHT